jgi:hypothetical protein
MPVAALPKPGTLPAPTNWEAGMQMHDGYLTVAEFALPTLFGKWIFMVKAVDTAGNESADAASLVIDFGEPLFHNVAYQKDWRADGFPGTVTNGSINPISQNLIADQVPTLFWTSDNALFWDQSNPLALFWSGSYEEMTYEFSWVTPADAEGTSLLIETAILGNWTMYYRASAVADWTPFPGFISNVQSNYEYFFRVIVDAGKTQGEIFFLKGTLDALTITETLQDVAISTGG